MPNQQILYLLISVLLVFASCGGDDGGGVGPEPIDTTVMVTGLQIEPETVRLSIGGVKQLSVIVTPDSATNQGVTWSSSDPSTVDVDESGVVTALAVGNADITASAEGGVTATRTVSVSNLIIYEPSTEDFVNPDRGFYKYSQTNSGNYNPLSLNTLKAYRNGVNYGGSLMPVSLVFRYFVLGDFVDSPISEEYLDNVRADFEIAREAGVKLIPRFTYTVSANSGDCSEGFICPPYGDASKEVVLGHIGQLGPIMSENADVLLALQMGFIGTWGENYYTDHFGDASSNAGIHKLLDENWADRIDVLNALIAALPDEVMVQVRYPQMKQRAIYGIEAPTTSDPLSVSEAFSGSAKSRIGFHNDCLFASGDDFGTYRNYGNSSSSATTDITNLKPYFAEDSKYVVVGGETCSDGYSPQNDCSPVGMADTDLRYLHYTYLNADYNNEVNLDWVDGGCMDEIKRNLGYRLVLDSAGLPDEVASGESLSVSIYISNIGYAAPVKSRPVYLVLRNSSADVKFEFDTDIRFWLSGVSLTQSFEIPESMASGSYEILLYLPDANSSIEDRPEYAIRLANDLWETETGMNNLNHSVAIGQ
ncbi:MAG: DUF4832 domain-containing protein [Marinoscillum sp.]